MTTRPGYIWSGTEWVSIGQEAAVAPVSYQASAPSTPATGDIWIDSNDDVPGIDTSQFLRWRKTAVGGETSVSGTDDNGLTLQYTANYEQVYLNGVLLVRGQDYTATNGTSITGLTALAANDVVEVFGVVARVIGDVYTQAQADAKYSPVTTTGLVLLNPLTANNTFTSVSSFSIDNCFTSAYTNYRIVLMVDSGSVTNSEVRFRLRSGGTDNTATSYQESGWFVRSSGASGSVWSQNTTFFIIGYMDPNTSATSLDIFSPQRAITTNIVGNVDFGISGTDGQYVATIGGKHYVSSSFDGFTIYPSSGTFTGTIKVYGYK